MRTWQQRSARSAAQDCPNRTDLARCAQPRAPRSYHQRQSCCARLCQEAQLAPVLLGQADETLPHLSVRADVLAELGDDL